MVMRRLCRRPDGGSMLPVMENLLALPPEDLTRFLLTEPESQWFDRKSARIQAAGLSKTLVAMANAEGGIIVIGMHDGVCEGIADRPEKQNEWRQAGLDFTNPPVRFEQRLLECVNHNGAADRLFVIEVPPSEQVHATNKDEVFLRVGDENRKLNFEQRLQLRYDRGDTTFERTPVRSFGDAMLDFHAVNEYAYRVGHPDPIRLLQARDLTDLDGTTFTAGQLLFGVNPQRAYPQAYVRVLKFAGRERRTGMEQNLVSDIRCEGPLPRQIDAARQAVKEVLPERKSLGSDGRFGWFGIVPEEVWLEALVNAVIHRAYSNFGDHIRLEVFDNRIEVSSPGRFPGIVALDDLTQVRRFSRNPRIARVMAELSYGQELGEGLRRMVAGMESTGRQRPIVRQTSGGVTVTLLGEVARGDRLMGLPPTARDIFQQLSLLGATSTGDLVRSVSRSRPVVLRNLRLLEARGLVQRIGNSPTDPQAYWSVSAIG